MKDATADSTDPPNVHSRIPVRSRSFYDRMKYPLVLAPVLLIVLVYFKALNAPFTFDDEPNILNNPSIRLIRISVDDLKKAALENPIRNRPLAYLSFAFNYYVHRHDARGYRMVNILIHIIAGFALWGILYSTLTLDQGRVSGLDPKRAFVIACLASMLWLVHPVNTQSVTYIVQRMNSMSAMFYLIAVYAYIQSRLARAFRNRMLLLLSAVLCGLLAFGSRESAITLPVVCFLYEWIFFRQADPKWLRNRILPFMIVLSVLGAAAFLTLGDYHLNTILLLKGYDRFEFSLPQRVMTEWRVLVYYISLLAFPHPERLNLEYDYPLSFSVLTPPTTFIAAVALLLILILAVYTVRRKPIVSFCLFWFLTNHAIESSFISLAIIYEYRNYLPSTLPVLLVPVLLSKINRSFPFQVVLCVFLIALSGIWTFRRNSIWSDEIALWKDCVAKTPGLSLPHENLAVALTGKNRLDEALDHIRKALDLEPHSPLTNTNMGNILEKRGDRESAQSYYRKALELEPAYIPAMNNLANSLADQGRYPEAVKLYQNALRLNPMVEQTHFNLAMALIEMNNPHEADHHLRQTILLNPEHPKARFMRVLALIDMDRIEDATRLFQEVLDRKHPDPETFRNMGLALIRREKFHLAREYLEEAVALAPEERSTRLALTHVLLHQGYVEDAIREFAGLLRSNPDAPDIHVELENTFSRRFDRDRAVVILVEMIQSTPDNPFFLFILGSLHHKNREFLAARSAYLSALAIDPGFIPAMFNLARLHASMREYDRALSIYTFIISKRPDFIAAYYNVACLHALRKDVEKALEWLNLSIQKGFDRWEYMANDPDLENLRDHMDLAGWIHDKRRGRISE